MLLENYMMCKEEHNFLQSCGKLFVYTKTLYINNVYWIAVQINCETEFKWYVHILSVPLHALSDKSLMVVEQKKKRVDLIHCLCMYWYIIHKSLCLYWNAIQINCGTEFKQCVHPFFCSSTVSPTKTLWLSSKQMPPFKKVYQSPLKRRSLERSLEE